VTDEADATRVVVDIEIVSDETLGLEGGFLAIRRLHLVNVRADGSRSEPYVCDFAIRPRGLDAVVVVLFTREDGRVRVLLRDGLRPALRFGRCPGDVPCPDPRRYLFFREVVAGIVEPHERGEDGLRRRAASEVLEEAGYEIDPADVWLLGAGTFPTPGSMAERFYLCGVEVTEPDLVQIPGGDGSPMEEGARVEWMDLDAALAACVSGEIEDAKTELCLRRLADRLVRNRPH
jgi:ADP-ribose pyrophosphatase